jgi:hypothetical protein
VRLSPFPVKFLACVTSVISSVENSEPRSYQVKMFILSVDSLHFRFICKYDSKSPANVSHSYLFL